MRIFLSYRREDAAPWAGRLHDVLAARFGEQNIFQDVVAVRPGQNFTDAIDEALSRSDVVLVVIGPRWLAAADADGEPRLVKSDDYVRAELTAALAHAKQIIPVLVGGATMPTAAQLPEGLEELGLRQAVDVHDASWRQDVDGLIRSLPGAREAFGRRAWLIGAGAAVVLLAAGVAAWQLLDDGKSNKGPQSGAPASSTNDTPKACPTPSSEWQDLGVTGSTDVGEPQPSWHFDVLSAHDRAEESGRWYLVVRAKARNRTNSSQTHYPEFYNLSLDGTRFEPDCFDVVAGQNPLSPGAVSEALVGFDLTADPARGFAVDLDTIGEFGRIELTP